MKKNTTFIFTLLLLLLGLYSCENAPASEDNTATDTNTEVPADNTTDAPPAPAFDYTLEGKRAGDFAIGTPITTTAEEKGYTVEKRSRMGEGEEEPYYIISGEGEALLQVEPKYNIETQSYEDAVGRIIVLSSRYKMPNGLRVGSSIEDFQGHYTDARFLYSNVGDRYIMESPSLPVQFLLEEADFTISDKKLTGESSILKAADFKAGSKVTGIRIY